MHYKLICFFLLFSLLSFGQIKDGCTYTYFTDKKVSTQRCENTDGFQGKTTAYNQKGEVIGEWIISRTAMIAGVHFSFHSNGGVHKAEYSSHPDAGIQWYRSTTTYDENGNKIDFFEQSHDDHLKLFEPSRPVVQIDTIVKEKPVKFEIPSDHISELWMDNRSGKHLMISVLEKQTGEVKYVEIKPGIRAEIAVFEARTFSNPMEKLEIIVLNKKGNPSKKAKLGTLLVDESFGDTKRKAYVYDLVNSAVDDER